MLLLSYSCSIGQMSFIKTAKPLNTQNVKLNVSKKRIMTNSSENKIKLAKKISNKERLLVQKFAHLDTEFRRLQKFQGNEECPESIIEDYAELIKDMRIEVDERINELENNIGKDDQMIKKFEEKKLDCTDKAFELLERRNNLVEDMLGEYKKLYDEYAGIARSLKESMNIMKGLPEI